MKKMWLVTSMLCALLLCAGFAAAEVSQGLDTWDTYGKGTQDIGPGMTKYMPYSEPKQQRLLVDDYQDWFYFDQLSYPQVQRIIDVGSLDIEQGDLATPSIAGAQRVLTENYAWRYGYDIETGEPLLSPWSGDRKVLKRSWYRGYTGSPLALESALPVQMRQREQFQASRARRMAQWLAKEHRRLPVIRRQSNFPVISVESLEDLDTRPIYLDWYEYRQGLRDFHSNIMLRQHFLGDMPGISFNELRQLAGEHQLRSNELSRLEFMTREGTEDDVQINDRGLRFGQTQGLDGEVRSGDVDSNTLLRRAFLRSAPGVRGIDTMVYERYPETRQE